MKRKPHFLSQLSRPRLSFKNCLIFAFALFVLQTATAGFCQLPPLGNLLPSSPGSGSILTQPGSAQPDSQPSLSSQLLYLKAEGEVGAESPSSSVFAFMLAVPAYYNVNLAGNTHLPSWTLDPQAEILGSNPIAPDLLFTGSLGVDAAIYPDNQGYNLDTLATQLQINFTDQGVHFKGAPFIAYKGEFSIPGAASGHAWVNDVEAGFNFNGIFGSDNGPLEIDFNPGISQRWLQVNDSEGNGSNSGSTALELEIPIICKFVPRLSLILDPTGYTRLYDFHQDAANQNRLDQAISCPAYLVWGMIPEIQLQVIAFGIYSYQVSSVAGQDATQLNTGLELQEYF
jgi:hypothetical protein